MSEVRDRSSREVGDETGGEPRLPFRYTARLANEIEERWQAEWERQGTFIAPNPGQPRFDRSKPKFYVLDMFPYPSGTGLHVGHPEGYTATDIVARYKRMRGFNVLHPMGWDAFGLPAEQYAVQTNVHPAITTKEAIGTFRRQLKRFGFSYDWSREFATIDPDYYRWTQWIWLKAYHAWYDPWQNRARPIDELIQDLENGHLFVGPSGELVNPGVEGRIEALSGEPVGLRKWHGLSAEERREFIDDQRLAYLDEQMVNWCPKLGTVLANEEVIDGKSERGGFPVQRLPLKQWMFRITAYAERLLRDLEPLDWPVSTKTMQKEWIGRSEGAEIEFPIDHTYAGPREEVDSETVARAASRLTGWIGSLRVFTTRPDTIFGATYMVVAPEHPLIDELLVQNVGAGGREIQTALREYVTWTRNRTDIERQEAKEKSGVFAGVYALNPATKEHIPVWVADYVLMGYGHGAIMAVPGHDVRDFEFAQQHALPMRAVVMPPDGWLLAFGGFASGTFTYNVTPEEGKEFLSRNPRGTVIPTHVVQSARAKYLESPEAFRGAFYIEGVAVNSENDEVSLNGLSTTDAKDKIIHWLHMTGRGERKVNYKLRDWLFSRQRYWGEPFPVVFDEKGNHYPIDEAHLPVKLPELADFKPIESDTPQPPLAKATSWVNTTAGDAGVDPSLLSPNARVKRETNTMPNWAGSCWYYLRFCDPKNDERFVGEGAEKYWMRGATETNAHAVHGVGVQPSTSAGVDLYIGGSEHAVLHLLYARFWHKILFDLGFVSTPEPMGRLFHQGLIISQAFQRADKSLVPVDEVEEVAQVTRPVAVGRVGDTPDHDSESRSNPHGSESRATMFIEKKTGARVTQINAKMSKSLKNVVNPDDVIAKYGADTFRLYEMSMGPLEASKPWNTRDIAGPFRFLQRAWRLAIDEETGEIAPKAHGSESVGINDIERALHRTIQKVGNDIERLAFNTAIAAMMEFVNVATTPGSGGLPREQIDRFARVLAPFAPHVAEEIWQRLGHAESIAFAPWPEVDPALLAEEEVEIPVQIMGKVRARIKVPAGANEQMMETLALADAKVKEQLQGRAIRKVIVVEGKIINIVLG